MEEHARLSVPPLLFYACAQVDDRLATVLDIEARLQQMSQLSEVYQQREAIFGLSPTDHPQVRQLRSGWCTFRDKAYLWWGGQAGRRVVCDERG